MLFVHDRGLKDSQEKGMLTTLKLAFMREASGRCLTAEAGITEYIIKKLNKGV